MSRKQLPARVLMVVYSYYESDTRVIREAEAARDAGFEVDVLALRDQGLPSTEIANGVRVFRLGQNKYQGKNYSKYLAAYLEFFVRSFAWITCHWIKQRYSVIHVNNMPDFLVFASLIPRVFGTKIILDIHDSMPNTFAAKFGKGDRGIVYRLLMWEERISAMFSDVVVTVNQPVKECVLVKHGLVRESIEVIANYADHKMFPLQSTFSADTIRLVFHGTIHERAGLMVVLKAIHNMTCVRNISFTIIGDGDYADTLNKAIEEMGLSNIVSFDRGFYPSDSIATRVQQCNVGIVPLKLSSATQYALPLKLVEYVALGLPVITIDTPTIRYYMEDGDCMYFNDEESLTRLLDTLVMTPDIIQKYRARSLDVREKLSWQGEKERYSALLWRLSGIPVQA